MSDSSSRVSPPDAHEASAHEPKRLAQPLTIDSRLTLSPAHMPIADPEQAALLEDLAARAAVSIELDQEAVDRLFQLWNTLQVVGADQIGDWSFAAAFAVRYDDAAPSPAPLGLSVTVFADGDVACSVDFADMDAALWFRQPFNLRDLEAS